MGQSSIEITIVRVAIAAALCAVVLDLVTRI